MVHSTEEPRASRSDSKEGRLWLQGSVLERRYRVSISLETRENRVTSVREMVD